MLSSPLPLPLALLAVQAGEVAGTSGVAGTPVPGAWGPLLLLGLPGAVALLLIVLYVRTARQHRRALMAPPVWLLPYLERPGEGEGPPALPAPDADHLALEEMRVESTARLARRKRVLLVGLGLNFVAGWAGAAVYLYSANRQVEFEELPVLGPRLEDVVDTVGFRGLEGRVDSVEVTEAPERTAPPPADTAALRLRRERLALQAARQRDSLAEVARRDSVALAEQIARQVRDSVARALQDSLARVAAVAPAPSPTPPRPAGPDPALVQARADEAVRATAGRLVAAIARAEGLAGLLGSGDAQARFLRFVEEFRPSASAGQTEPAAISGGAATATVAVPLAWRGGFGQNRAATGRFRVELVRDGEGWRVLRIVPLQDLP